MKEYSVVEFKYQTQSYFFVYYNDKIDGFELQDNKLVVFDNFEEARTYCHEHDSTYNDEISVTDMVTIEEWVANGDGSDVDCELLLEFWNDTIDLATTFDLHYIGNDDEYLDVYNKLFYGNNLPSVNTSGKIYVPTWSETEVLELKKVIGTGLMLFAQAFNETKQ